MTLATGFQWGFAYSTGSNGVSEVVPSVAGGVCQVATTVFQPVFWAGYEIDERHWHMSHRNRLTVGSSRFGSPVPGDALGDQVRGPIVTTVVAQAAHDNRYGPLVRLSRPLALRLARKQTGRIEQVLDGQ